MKRSEVNFYNNPKIRNFWVDRIRQFTTDRWENGYKDFYTLDSFFSNQYENIVEDWNSSCYGGMGSDDEDLITDFTRDYPVIEEMVNGWGYDIEYSIIEYMDIMRELKDKLYMMNETKRTIKKILKEEVHPDYDFIDEGDELLPFKLPELKIMMATLKRMGAKNGVNNSNIGQYIDTLKNTFGFNDSGVISKMVLIGFFNSATDLVMAFKNNDPNRLYNGPFYMANLDYWEDDYEMEDDTIDETCDNCNGSGEEEDDCVSCGGDGYLGDEDLDEEEYECDDCEGTGKENIDCRECGGDGNVERDVTTYTVNNYELPLFTTQQIDIDEVVDTYRLMVDDDILRGKSNWIGSHSDDTAGSMLDYTGEADIVDQDIIVNGETIMSYLY